MSRSAVPALREASADDLPAIAALRASVDWAPHPWAMEALIGQPDAIFLVADDPDGGLAAMGSGIVYAPSLGFVGNMVVAEPYRRRGLGSEILDAVAGFLARAGCTRLELNATEEGRPLYERHGFASRGTSLGAGIARRGMRRIGSTAPVRRIGPDDLASLARYDAPRFGGDRTRLLGLLADESVGRGYVAEEEGAMTGFAFVQVGEDRLGPMVADSPEVAAALVAGVFAAHPELGELRLNLPPANTAGAAWLRRLRVAAREWDGRMARGPDLARRDDTIYQMTVGPLG